MFAGVVGGAKRPLDGLSTGWSFVVTKSLYIVIHRLELDPHV